MAIDGRTAYQLSEALLDAFLPDQLDQLLYYRLDRQRHRISMKASYDAIVFDVIRTADAEGWLDRLVVAARQSRPSHPGLFLSAQRRELAVETTGLESILNEHAPEIRPAEFRAGLGALEGQVCRIELTSQVGPQPLGTGFLVGPNLCMTSYHVVHELFSGTLKPEDVRLRFDFKYSATGDRLFPGTIFRLAEDWAVASAPHSDFERHGNNADEQPAAHELDFAVLRVAGFPGQQPIGEAFEPTAARRGWISAPSPTQVAEGEDILVLQHLMGKPMRLTFGKVIEVNSNGTRIKHTADTDQGSSGSPCFTLGLNLAAIHQAGDPNREPWRAPSFNRAVPAATIFSILAPESLAPTA